MASRRHFLKLCGSGLASYLAGCSFGKQTSSFHITKRPNLIIIMADQLRYQSVGYAGDAKSRTPNIDKLAARGVDFCQAVSSMPVCSAYRASLFTGKYTTSTGMVINELRMNPNHRCLGHCLTEAGYETGYIGKWHLYANQLGNHNDPKNSFVPRGPHRLGFDGYWAAYNFHHDYYDTYYHTETPEKISYPRGSFEPDAQTDMAINFIRQKAGGNAPFALILSVGTPHDPWAQNNVPKKYYNMFKDTKFPPSPNYSDKMDPYGDGWSNIKKTPEMLERWMRVYYAMTANLDYNVGRLIDALDKAHLINDTIIVFTSDHGEMFGAHGRMKKNIFYEEAARVPFLIGWPKKIPASLKSDVCLNTVDIMPTLLGLMNLQIPEAVEGMDLSRRAMGKKGPEPKAALLMNTGACAIWEDGHEWRALRDKKYTYAIFQDRKKEVLFDNIADPYQMNNLISDPAHAEKTRHFRAMLKEKMAELNDTFPTSTWYRENWVQDRTIMRSATMR